MLATLACPLGAQVPVPALSVLDAARMTVAAQPDIRLQEQQVAFSRSTFQAAQGQFDPRVRGAFYRGRENLPFTSAQIDQSFGLFTSAVTNTTLYRASLEKQFRTGLVVSPAVEVVRQDLNYQEPATNRATVGVGVTQPLLRGRGREVVTANEQAARLEVEASGLELRHTVSGTVARTLDSYWGYVAAARAVEVLRSAEERAGRLVSQIQELIAGGQRPAADIKQVQATLSDRIAQRARTELALVSAREQLGVAIGLPADQIRALPLPGDDFPVVEPEDARSALPVPWLVEQARQQRTDLQAFARRQRQAQVLRAEARDALRPQLNLNGSVGYAGLDEGLGFGRLFTPLEPAGFNASASLALEWPTFNNEALGVLGRREAAYQQVSLQAGELERQIASNVAAAAEAVRLNALRVQSARDASELYRSAVTDEWTKLQIGLSTIIDLILTEDRLTQSLLNEIEAQQSYAVAVARLRYETGTLLGDDGGERPDPARAIDRERLTRAPAPGR